MKNIFALALCFLAGLPLKGQDSTRVFHHFASLYGSTGLIQTPDTRTVGKWNGNIGVFENFQSDSLDRLAFSFGVHPNIEVGLESDIPSQPDARLHFFFKVKGFQQGRLFRWRSKFFPATAFGIQRNGAFALAGYAFKTMACAAGYNFSDGQQGGFVNFSYQPVDFLALQSEYFNGSLGLGLRTSYKGFEISVLYLHALKDEKFMAQHAYWRIAYNFKSADK